LSNRRLALILLIVAAAARVHVYLAEVAGRIAWPTSPSDADFLLYIGVFYGRAVLAMGLGAALAWPRERRVFSLRLGGPLEAAGSRVLRTALLAVSLGAGALVGLIPPTVLLEWAPSLAWLNWFHANGTLALVWVWFGALLADVVPRRR